MSARNWLPLDHRVQVLKSPGLRADYHDTLDSAVAACRGHIAAGGLWVYIRHGSGRAQKFTAKTIAQLW